MNRLAGTEAFMPYQRIEAVLSSELESLQKTGGRKGREVVFTGVIAATEDRGPRFLLEGEGDKPFIRMNSNS